MLDLDTERRSLERLAWGLAPSVPPRRPTDDLVLASRTGLERAFGAGGFHAVNHALLRLARLTGRDLVYVDDPVSLAPFGGAVLDTPDQAPAWAAWLDRFAPHTRSLLLVGGPDLAPFGRVANPSDDDDGPLASDAPLAGPRPLAPQRAVGRLPDAGDAAFLIQVVQATCAAHAAAQRARARWTPARSRRPLPPAIGYTASVWRHAARAVFASLDSPQRLRMSPPLDHQYAPRVQADDFCPAYFNLHGLPDTPGWYGQRDPLLAADYPHFPLALHPDALAPTRHGQRLVVFSAACYGAAIEGKTPATSLALRFLSTQAAAFVGATALAYGGLSEPLQASDQLAYLFWAELQAGQSVGEALRRAKLGLVETVTARQGYLDAEDQKASLTFTLYGDPTLTPFPRGRSATAVHHGHLSSSHLTGFGNLSGVQAKLRPSGGSPVETNVSSGGDWGLNAPAYPEAHLTGFGNLSGVERAGLPPDLLQRVEQELRLRLPDLGQLEVRPARPLYAKAPGVETPALTLTVTETTPRQPFRHRMKVTLGPDGAVTKLVMAHGGPR